MLRHRKHRRREGAFFVEGPRVFLTAAETGAPVENVLYAPDLLASEPVRLAIERLRAGGVRCESVTRHVFEWVSERDHPTGIGAIVAAEDRSADELPAAEDALYVALLEVSDPGNLGAIMRTMDAVGGTGLLLVGRTTDPTHPTAIKASMGALFTVPHARVDDVDALLEWARGRRLRTVGTSAHADRPAWDADLRPPILLVLGSEREGLDERTMQLLDERVTLPMRGDATSLNLAVAAGVLLYEVRRPGRA
jgi:TrmH family RNA methyltransferase